MCMPYMHKYLTYAYTMCMQIPGIYMRLDFLKFDIYIGGVKTCPAYSMVLVTRINKHICKQRASGSQSTARKEKGWRSERVSMSD